MNPDRYAAFGITNTLVMGLRADIHAVRDGADVCYRESASPLRVKDAHDTWREREPERRDEKAELANAAVVIDFGLIGSAAEVDLYIEYDSASQVHVDFYGSRHSDTLPSPRVVTLIEGETLLMGANRVCWDGRDSTGDGRILLAGEYTLHLVARAGRLVRRARTTIEIAPPTSWSLGMNITKRGVVENSADAMRTTGTHLTSLPDGTAYSGDATGACTAVAANDYWRKSAIAVFDGHADPQSLMFLSQEGVPRRQAVASSLKGPIVRITDAELRRGSLSLATQPQDVYQDLLLAVLLGCRSGDNLTTVHRLIQLIRRTLNVPVTGSMNSRTSLGIRAFEMARGMPRTGTPNMEVGEALGVTFAGVEPTAGELRQIQRALRQWSRHIPAVAEPNDETEADRERRYADEIRRFQQLAWLPETGIADRATKERLRLAGAERMTAENIAQEFMRRGCEVALGFPEYSCFGPAEDWVTKFVESLANGNTIESANDVARQAVGSEHRPHLRFRGYSEDALWSELRIFPARYGAT